MVLYDENASPEKVARMQETAQETTSLETGVRLTGFQVSRSSFLLGF
jgi:1D-myo-inositol-tetrakisphosphate 5-kinase/inositol-polyphosphate multikinase